MTGTYIVFTLALCTVSFFVGSFLMRNQAMQAVRDSEQKVNQLLAFFQLCNGEDFEKEFPIAKFLEVKMTWNQHVQTGPGLGFGMMKLNFRADRKSMADMTGENEE